MNCPYYGEPCSVRELLEIALAKNGERTEDIVACACESDYYSLMDEVVYPMDKSYPCVKFTIWTDEYAYFPLVNDMGVKWVSSVSRNPVNVPLLIEC